MADALLSTTVIADELVAGLAAFLPAGVGAYSVAAVESATRPFVVVAPTWPHLQQWSLSGSNDLNGLVVTTYSVHDTLPQASSLRDLVRTWFVGTDPDSGSWAYDITLTGLSVLRRVVERSIDPQIVAQVPQAVEAYRLTLARGA